MDVTDTPDSYFSKDYSDARRHFIGLARERGGRVHSRRIRAAGPGDQPLYIDSAAFGDAHPRRLLVIVSGTHGVEGFAGSALQRHCLATLKRDQPWPAGYGELWLHALNPYGFAWLRRTNENNIDLNRNCLERFPGPANPMYRTLNLLLNPASAPGRGDGFMPKLLWIALTRGIGFVRQAIAGGQYEFPRGLFYGGDGKQESIAIYESMLSDPAFGAVETVVQLDLHSGLGPWGRCTVLPSVVPKDPASMPAYEALSSWLPPRCRGKAYEVHGGLGNALCRILPQARCLAFVVEFGTHSMLHMLATLREENRAHYYRNPDAPARVRAKTRLLESACPNDHRWRHRVLTGGARLIARVRSAISGTA